MLRVLGSPKQLCDGFTRREMLVGGGLSLLGLTLADLLRAMRPARRRRCAQLWPGEGVHPAVPLRLAEPARTGGHEAGRPRRDPWRAGVDPLHVPGCDVCELLPQHGPGHGSRHRRALDDAPLSDPRRRLRHDRRADHRRADGAQSRTTPGTGPSSAPWSSISKRARGLAQPDPQQHRPALALQHPAQSARCQRGSLRRLPGQRLQSDLDRVPRRRHAQDGEDPDGQDRGRARTVPRDHTGEPLRARPPRRRCRTISRSTASTPAAASSSQFDQARRELDRTAAGRSLDRYRQMA